MTIEYPTSALIACVDRELRMRNQVYPRWVKRGTLTAAAAAREIGTMTAVRSRIIWAEAAELVLLQNPGWGQAADLSARVADLMRTYNPRVEDLPLLVG